jgi:hypothetical protein
MRFVVTGTGRSGTGYAAKLFTAAGLSCGHEAVFTDKPGLWDKAAPRHGLLPRLSEPLARIREERRRRATYLEGDASWMAAPRLSRFNGVSFLQLRHPIPVIRSFMGTRFFSNPEKHRAQRRFAAAHFAVTGDDIVDAMRWWVFWNELADRAADVTYRLEDLDADLFTTLLTKLGVDDAERRAAEAFEQAPRDFNSSTRRGNTPGSVTWFDLPEGEDKERLQTAAVKWGYDPADPAHDA